MMNLMMDSRKECQGDKAEHIIIANEDELMLLWDCVTGRFDQLVTRTDAETVHKAARIARLSQSMREALAGRSEPV